MRPLTSVRLPLLLGLAIILVYSVALIATDVGGRLPLYGPDSYARGVLALEALKGGRWDTLTGVVPGGLEMHWTKPVTALVLLGAAPLSLFMDAPAAIGAWAMVMPALLQALSLLILLWGTRAVLDTTGTTVAAALFLVHGYVAMQFSPGMIDQGGAILAVWLLCVSTGIRLMLAERPLRLAIAAGVSAGLAWWISVEAVIPAAALAAAVGFNWFLGRDRGAERGLPFGLAFLATTVMAVLLERGPGGFANLEIDRLSGYHLALAGVVAGTFVLAALFDRLAGGLKGPVALAARGVVGIVGGVAAYGVLKTLSPLVLLGAVAALDPIYNETRSAFILESEMGLTPTRLAVDPVGLLNTILLYLPFALPGLAYALWAAVRQPGALGSAWLVVLVSALAAVRGDTSIPIRDTPGIVVTTLIPAAGLIAAVLTHLAAGRPDGVAQRVRLYGGAGAIVLPFLLALATMPAKTDRTGDVGFCDLTPMMTHLAANPPTDRTVVIAHADFGPEILFKTRWLVPSIPNHRTQPGYRQTYEVFHAPDAEAAKRRVDAMNGGYIVQCQLGAGAPLEGRGPGKTTFGNMIAEGTLPDWLEALPLGSDPDNKVRIWRVR